MSGAGFPACEQPAKDHENGTETQAGKPAPLIPPGQMPHFARPSRFRELIQKWVDAEIELCKIKLRETDEG